jgi:hypothetical protein
MGLAPQGRIQGRDFPAFFSATKFDVNQRLVRRRIKFDLTERIPNEPGSADESVANCLHGVDLSEEGMS